MLRASAILTASLPLAVAVGNPSDLIPDFSSGSDFTSCFVELVLESGDLFSCRPSWDEARGDKGGVLFSRDTAAAFEVSVLSSSVDTGTLCLVRLDGSETFGLCGLGDCTVVEGFEMCAADTDFVLVLDTGNYW